MKPKHPTFTFRLKPDTLALLDKLRRNGPDLPSRGKMLCILVARASGINDGQVQARQAVSAPVEPTNPVATGPARSRRMRDALEKFITPQEGQLAKLPTKTRSALPKSDFGEPGSRKYPMPDKSHAANAKARASQAVNAGRMSSAEKGKIDAKADAKLGKGKSSGKK